ncbi:CFEM domain-containing protein [Ophiocordyceps camponoti-floridani]|uniref:CFEM domain-containing protein n=1 Tax=Ophiocordyceps camponoti-floridani TaxID=2030778 RepID=A0A8H4Q9X0_9HYPO|nr:CFEM domain-containing protein [Ophiocordyceps camponoti-floridani]
MKLLLPLTLLATVAGVSAQNEKCDADYIVQACLKSENAKVQMCPGADWDCLCAAYNAVATCYNNCPDNASAPSARQAASSNCQQASLYGTKAKAPKTSSMSGSSTSDMTATATVTDSASSTDGSSGSNRAATSFTTGTARPSSTGAASTLSGSAGGLFVAVAGVLAALL